ncbi:hypothetical protein ACVITL_004704 [Rhizobium pisi]
MNRNQLRECAVSRIDIGKNLFHVVGLDSSGAIVQRVKFRRETAVLRTNAQMHVNKVTVASAAKRGPHRTYRRQPAA